MKTILADLSKLKFQLQRLASPATVLDGMELICGGGYSLEEASHSIQTGWVDDPVHPVRHVYAKTALNLLEKLAPTNRPASEEQSRKNTWSSTQSDYGSGSGGKGKQTHRSSSWKDLRNCDRMSSGDEGGSGGGGGGG
jgi:hypothetical protein